MPLKHIALKSLVLLAIPFTLTALPLPKKILQHSEKQVEHSKGSSFCYITPPQGWEIADPKTLGKSVMIAFLKKNAAGFSPSINLAVEKTNLSLEEYLKAIRQLHEADKRNRWRKLGKVHTQSGIGQLTEIDTSTEWGAVRMLQLIVVQQGCAYVVTGAASKEEIAQYYKEFQASFRTLQITSDLISTIPQTQRREALKNQSEQLLAAWQKGLPASSEPSEHFNSPDFQNTYWLPFQNSVVQDYEDMGAHWQILMLKAMQEKMISQIPSSKSSLNENLPLQHDPIESKR